jgi:hypothetical protein
MRCTRHGEREEQRVTSADRDGEIVVAAGVAYTDRGQRRAWRRSA